MILSKCSFKHGHLFHLQRPHFTTQNDTVPKQTGHSGNHYVVLGCSWATAMSTTTKVSRTQVRVWNKEEKKERCDRECQDEGSPSCGEKLVEKAIRTAIPFLVPSASQTCLVSSLSHVSPCPPGHLSVAPVCELSNAQQMWLEAAVILALRLVAGRTAVSSIQDASAMVLALLLLRANWTA